MRISDWSSDVCSSDLDSRQSAFFQPIEQAADFRAQDRRVGECGKQALDRIEHDALRAHLLDRHFQANEQRLQIIIADLSQFGRIDRDMLDIDLVVGDELVERSEEHTSELQSLMRISYAVFCLKKKYTLN